MAHVRGLHIPLEELIFENELQIAKEKNCTAYHCPCTKCHGGHRYDIKTIRGHLRLNKRDPFLMHSMLGGDPVEGYPAQGIWVNAEGEIVAAENVFDDELDRTEYSQHLDPYHDIQQQLFDALSEGDDMRESMSYIQEDEANDDIVADTQQAMDALYEHTTRAVFRGTNVSVISATIVIINMAVIHGVSNAYVDELMKYLSTVLLPANNVLPRSHYEAKKLIKKLGLNYDVIHTCPSGCVLYRGENENLRECPEPSCGRSRFMEGSEKIPARVI